MFLEFTNKPEETYIVHLLSIFIRINELANLFCLEYYISSLKSNANHVTESFCRLLALHALTRNLIISQKMYRKCIILL